MISNYSHLQDMPKQGNSRIYASKICAVICPIHFIMVKDRNKWCIAYSGLSPYLGLHMFNLFLGRVQVELCMRVTRYILPYFPS